LASSLTISSLTSAIWQRCHLVGTGSLGLFGKLYGDGLDPADRGGFLPGGGHGDQVRDGWFYRPPVSGIVRWMLLRSSFS
jgi:hypothetical protein